MKTIASHAYEAHIGWLRMLRDEAGLTQAQLAKKLGKPQSYVAKVEVLERRLDVFEYVLWTRALAQDPSAAIKQLDSAMSTTGPHRRRLMGAD